MAKERLIQCQHYICEGQCDIKDKECKFWKEMQICPTYRKKPGSKPARQDLRRTKLDKISRKENKY